MINNKKTNDFLIFIGFLVFLKFFIDYALIDVTTILANSLHLSTFAYCHQGKDGHIQEIRRLLGHLKHIQSQE